MQPQQYNQPQQQQYNANPYDSYPLRKKGLPKFVKIILLALIVFGGLIGIIAVLTNKPVSAPQKSSDQFVNALQAGQSAAAYALTTDVFKQVTTEDALTNAIQEINPTIKGKEKLATTNVDDSAVLPDTAVFVYSVQGSDGLKYVKTQLQDDNGQWKVVTFNVSSKKLDNKIE